MEEIVSLVIGKAEALILFELLVDFFDDPTITIDDNAERLAMVRLGGVLEKTLVERFMENYQEIVDEARRRLNGPTRG